MKMEKYIKLVKKANIDEEEKRYIVDILEAAEELRDLPRDLVMRLEEIFMGEVKRLDKEEEELVEEKKELEAKLTEEKRDLPGKLEDIDRQAEEKLEKVETEALSKMDEIGREVLESEEKSKKRLDDKRYKDILDGLKGE